MRTTGMTFNALFPEATDADVDEEAADDAGVYLVLPVRGSPRPTAGFTLVDDGPEDG